jgi:hypothetical protein
LTQDWFGEDFTVEQKLAVAKADLALYRMLMAAERLRREMLARMPQGISPIAEGARSGRGQ